MTSSVITAGGVIVGYWRPCSTLRRSRSSPVSRLAILEIKRWGVPREEVRAGLRGAQVEIERRLDGSHWLRLRGRYLRLRHCLAPLRASASPSGLRPRGRNAETQKTKSKSNPNITCLPVTPGEDLGSRHFYLAKNRTFLLCVDSQVPAVSNAFRHIFPVCQSRFAESGSA